MSVEHVKRLRKVLSRLGEVRHGQVVDAQHHNILAEAWDVVKQFFDSLPPKLDPPQLKTLRRVRNLIDVILPEDNNDRVDNARAVTDWFYRLVLSRPWLRSDYSALSSETVNMRYVSYGDYVSAKDVNSQITFLRKLADALEHVLAFVSGIDVRVSVQSYIQYNKLGYIKRFRVRPWLRYPRTDVTGPKFTVSLLTIVYRLVSVPGPSIAVSYAYRYPRADVSGPIISVSPTTRYPRVDVSGPSLTVGLELHMWWRVNVSGPSLSIAYETRYPRVDVSGPSLGVSGSVRYPGVSVQGPGVSVSYTVTKVLSS
ncbi:MAG: hypothetical protein J7K15_10200 [Deltaproteobacteria bacterium]|nr:hypothetical protein [Deltaproteobacteria bacterium]